MIIMIVCGGILRNILNNLQEWFYDGAAARTLDLFPTRA